MTLSLNFSQFSFFCPSFSKLERFNFVCKVVKLRLNFEKPKKMIYSCQEKDFRFNPFFGKKNPIHRFGRKYFFRLPSRKKCLTFFPLFGVPQNILRQYSLNLYTPIFSMSCLPFNPSSFSAFLLANRAIPTKPPFHFFAEHSLVARNNIFNSTS